MHKRIWGKLKEAKVRDCVAVFLSEFYRGREDPANIVGIIMGIKDDKYRIGTKGEIRIKLPSSNLF